MSGITQKSLLYEKVKEEYEEYLNQLSKLNDEEIACRLHEFILKNIAFSLIEDDLCTYKEKEFLMSQLDPLETLYRMIRNSL